VDATTTDGPLDEGLAGRVLDCLGLPERPSLDPEGLTALYGAWGRAVPFDNVRKLIALHDPNVSTSTPLPGLDATDFFEQLLTHGVGGTCWPSANALTALATACGFTARRVTASMFDLNEPSHGTTIVTIDDTEWLIDSSMLTDRPLPLSTTENTAIDGPIFATTATPVPEGWLFGFPMPDGSSLPCRTLSPDETPLAFYTERYEVSRTWSPFNEHVYLRRNDRSGMVSMGNGRYATRTKSGDTNEELTRAGTRDALSAIGLSDEILDRLAAALPHELDPASSPTPGS
jgi:arylamine N-acetyltransferase